MLKIRLVRAVMTSFLALAGLIGGAEQANAALYVGKLDPLYFFGTATFDISDQCIGAPLFAGAPAGCTAALASTAIQINDPTNTFSLGIVDFGPGSGNDVSAFDWQGGGLPLLDVGAGPYFAAIGGFDFRLMFFIGNGTPGSGTAELDYDTCGDGCWALYPNADASLATQEVYTRIPEPGSLALLLGAAAAGCLVSRRKRQANEVPYRSFSSERVDL